MAIVRGIYLSLILALCASTQAQYNETDTNTFMRYAVYHGRSVLMSDELIRKLSKEAETWHWMPWQKTRTKTIDNVVTPLDCAGRDSINSFPDLILTDDQLRKGGFLMYVVLCACAFTFIAIVCNDYFIPTVELICENLKIPQNVAAATFMSVATSCPEFFVNLISTFVTESDMGIGTIIGSGIFNALGIAAIGGIAAIRPIPIDIRPVTRDVVIYLINVSALVAIVWDGEIDWHEALVLFIMYICYFLLMFNSTRLFRLYDKLSGKCYNNSLDISDSVEETGKSNGVDNPAFSGISAGPEIVVNGLQTDKVSGVDGADEDEEMPYSLWRFPREAPLVERMFWVFSWPLKFVLIMTVPSPVTCKKWYPLTFVMCIAWIGINSYVVTWSMTVIGFALFIPDSVMGMTFLAFGGCVPEACAIFIMSRRGEGGIGVSNALGANSLAILFALGVPWLIRTLALLFEGAENPVVIINSSGIEFIVGSLFIAVVTLWITLYFGKFVLKKPVGYVFACFYAIFVTFALLVEMGIIFERALPLCGF